MKSLNKTETDFLSLMCSSFPKVTFKNFCLTTAADIKCHIVDVKSLPLLHQSVIFIFISLGVSKLHSLS